MQGPPAAGPSTSAVSRLAAVQRHVTGATTGTSQNIERIAVFGAGLMGAGIAQVAAQNGFQVVLCDVTDAALRNGLDIVSKSLRRLAEKMAPDKSVNLIEQTLARIETTVDQKQAVKSADFVIEAIIEDLETKQKLFAMLDAHAPPHCIFATNTSSLSVEDIAAQVSEERRTKFTGMHFFNPVPVMRLVELIRLPPTSNETFEAVKDVAKRMKKTAVTCKDTPGFIVNRLLIPYTLDAIRMLERGDASPQDIDTAMKLGAGYPMGPFSLLDVVGLDTTAYIMQGWQKQAERGQVSKDLVRPSPILQKMVQEGRLGRKTGKGFYNVSSFGK